MLTRISFAVFLIILCTVCAAPNNNLYDRNRRDADCGESGCYPRRPPYYMPKGYVSNPSDTEDDEEVAEIEPGLEDDYQETETGSSQRLIF